MPNSKYTWINIKIFIQCNNEFPAEQAILFIEEVNLIVESSAKINRSPYFFFSKHNC